MDCKFTLCSARDTVEEVAKRMMMDKSSFAIITDDNNSYLGVITANDLLWATFDTLVGPLVQEIEPVPETGLVAHLRGVNSEIIPVINMDRNVTGIISLRSLLEYLPEAVVMGEAHKNPNFRRTAQLNAKYTINDIIGQSKSILLLKEQIIAAAKTRSTVLILGETGTGKELVAHAIHRLSNRRHNPFVRVNCAAIPDNLLESELFGYEPGAFTGAGKGGHIGKFEMADEGTIFLDEIGDMPLSLQSKILRVLQEKEIEKVGGRVPIPVDVRIIAATHRNLRGLIKENKFREDLYYRLHVIAIQLPPLRNHPEDIPLLMDYFLEKQAEELGIPKPRVEREFLGALVEYEWPGNMRELANTMEQAISLSSGTITTEHVPVYIREGRSLKRYEGDEAALLRNYADGAEREAILKALEFYKGNKIKVSDALGISRSSLYNKLKKYGIDV